MTLRVKRAFDKLKQIREIFWSGRPDSNRGPPALKAGGRLKTTPPFSATVMKNNSLVETLACGWLCANVPMCMSGGHKTWHTFRDSTKALLRERLFRR